MIAESPWAVVKSVPMDNQSLYHANTKDLSGKVFGRLTVLSRSSPRGDPVRWTCRCECGALAEVRSSKLTSGATKSCGCLRLERNRSFNLSRNKFEGLTFGRLTVRERTVQSGTMCWVCACSCGNEKIATTRYLKSSPEPSCGCAEREAAAARRFIDLSGRRFGKLVAVEHVGFDASRKSKWRCLCDCGSVHIARGNSLVSGRTISCGCARREDETYMSADALAKSAAKCARRRALKRDAEGSHTAQQVSELFERQRGRCACCSGKLPREYHRDHIVALANGGTNWIWNIQLLCGPCHRTKGTMDPIEWARKFGRLL